MPATDPRKEKPGTCPLPPEKTVTPAGLLIIVLSVGLAAGLVEVLFTAIRSNFEPIQNISRDYVWMTPTAVMLCTLAVTLPFVAAWNFLKHPALVRMFLVSLCIVILFDLLTFITPIHHAVLLAMALTLSIVISVPLFDHLHSLIRSTRKSLPYLVTFVALLGVAERGLVWFQERESIAHLPAPPDNAPNVILITLDTVRAANLSVYGYSRETTPRLQAFAKTGVVFEHALSSSPWTLPAHATMFTGRWHHELSVDYFLPLDNTFPTLAEFLASLGYLTAGFVANSHYCGHETGLEQGFIRYQDHVVSLGEVFSSTRLRAVFAHKRIRKWLKSDEKLDRKSAALINSRVLQWLGTVGNRPFFLFVNYYDAHSPYLPPSPYDRIFGPPRSRGKISFAERWMGDRDSRPVSSANADVQEEINAYDGALKYLDDQMYELFEQISSLGKLNNTLVIITSDHGEAFGEHGLLGHGNSLYRTSVEVPLIVRFPDRIPRGVRIDTPVTVRDLAATVVGLIGLKDESPFPGHSLARYWQGERSSKASPPLLQTLLHAPGNAGWLPVSKGDMHSILSEGYRYVLNGDGVEELYDFDADPWEHEDLAGLPQHAELLKRLRKRLGEMLAKGKEYRQSEQ